MTEKRSFMDGLKQIMRGGGYKVVSATAPDRLRLSGKGLNIPLNGQSFLVEMGKQTLHFVPDKPLGLDTGNDADHYMVYDPERFAQGIWHGLRLKPGKTLSIDHRKEKQRLVVSHPKAAFRRHLQVRHEGDSLVFRDPISELGSYVSVIQDEATASALARQRADNAERLIRLCEGPIGPLAQRRAAEVLALVNEHMKTDPYRAPDSMGNVGSLLKLPGYLTPIIVGDLHGQLDNLVRILTENAFLSAVQQGTAALIFLGDAVHLEEEGQLEQMESSMAVMDLILCLKSQFPQNVFFLQGNHDGFSPDVMKGGVAQALLWQKYLLEQRGEAYIQALSLFYRQCPLVALSQDFVACHAGPPRSKTSREQLIEAREFPDLVHELTWNRIRTKGWPMGYKRGDVNRFRRSLELDEDPPFIVAHYPQDGKKTVWPNVGDINEHHIVYSARKNQVAIYTAIDHQMLPMIFPGGPVVNAVNSLAVAGGRQTPRAP